MKVLTAAQMREVDRLTIERGIPGLILMENAGVRVVEFLAERFSPLSSQRIVAICGNGNDGGGGFKGGGGADSRFRPGRWCVTVCTDLGAARCVSVQ